jgi:hypothetical protein
MIFYGVAMKITSKSPVNHWTSRGTLRFGQGVAVVSALDADLDTRRDDFRMRCAGGEWEDGLPRNVVYMHDTTYIYDHICPI